MNDIVTLFRLPETGEVEAGRSGASSILFLAEQRPEEYIVRDFEHETSPLAAPRHSVIHCRAFGKLEHRVSWVLAQPGVRAWIAAGIPLVFDQSPEIGLSTAHQWRSFRDLLQQDGIASGRFIWLQQNERASAMLGEALDDESGIRVRNVIFHYWLHRTRIEVSSGQLRPGREEIRARFLCLNRRIRLHRAVVLGWLEREGLLEMGAVSIPEFDIGDRRSLWSNFAAFSSEALAAFPGFSAEIAACEHLLETARRLDEGVPAPYDIPWALHAQTGFSLVNETEMRRGKVQRFTEKTLKPLATWQPLLVAGNVGTLALLRAYGFRTFSPWIDESYDLIDGPEERLRAVLAEARRLIMMPDNEFGRLLDDLDDVLSYNHRHFMDGLPAIMDRQHMDFRRTVAELSAAG